MGTWNEDDHPRVRAGAAGGHGGEFEDKPVMGDDTDLDMGADMETMGMRRLTSLLEARVPLDHERTAKVPTLDPDDTTGKGRAKLARYLWNTLDPDADHTELERNAMERLMPGATLTPRDELPDVPARALRQLEAKTGLPVNVWRTDEDGGGWLYVFDGPHKSGRQRIGYRFKRTREHVDETSLADLMAAGVIADEAGGFDAPHARALLEDPKANYLDDLTTKWPVTDQGWFDAMAESGIDLPAPPDPLEDKAAFDAWLDKARAVSESPDTPYLTRGVVRSAVRMAEYVAPRRADAVRARKALAATLGGESDAMANRKWERKRESGTSASVWQDKKNQDPEHVAVASRNAFTPDFGHMEIDDDVDLNRFRDLSGEYLTYRRLLPSSPVKPELRWRYTGRHRATGVYFPNRRVMAVDPRTPSSFTHEWFHHLDHTTTESDLSLDPRFRRILDHYRSTVDRSRMGSNTDHWLAPTEVFARAGETWMSRHGGDGSSLLDTREAYETGWQYAPFRDVQADIDALFSDWFGR